MIQSCAAIASSQIAAGTIVLSRGEVWSDDWAGRWLACANDLALGFSHWLIAAIALTAGLTVFFAVSKLQAALKSKPIAPEPETIVAEQSTLF